MSFSSTAPEGSGLFHTWANENGSYEVELPAGHYYAVICSSNTKRKWNEPVDEHVKTNIKTLDSIVE
jgi:hypothetical protein